MELYTLDGLFRRTEMVEGYESFIWAERFADTGDLQIITPSTQQFRNLLASGTMLGMSESRRVMKVKTIEDTVSEEGIKQLKVTASEIIDITKERVALTGTSGEGPATWQATGKPSDIIRTLFDYVCRNGLSAPGDQLPLLVAGSLYPAGNIPEEETVYIAEREIGPLYNSIKEFADVWDLGFRLYKGDDDGKLYFEPYTGNDRTTSQTILPAVIFSPDLDSLQNVSELTSVANSKNVAQVINEYYTVTVFAQGASESTSGFDKRVLHVDATSIGYTPRDIVIPDDQQKAINKAAGLKEALEDIRVILQKLSQKRRLEEADQTTLTAWLGTMVPTYLTSGDVTFINAAVTASMALNEAETDAMLAAMLQLGTDELAKNRSISAFDGEITQLSPYKYRRDYDLGDLVEMRNASGLTNQMLVTEQIFTADATGERAYPTLTIKLFITPGSWLAWENTQVWQDAPGTWSEA